MKLEELLSGVTCRLLQGSFEVQIEKIAVHSARVSKGTVFVCIRGEKTDGNAFLSPAIQAGAVAIVTDRLPESFPGPAITVVFVEDARTALARMAANFYGNPARKLCMIGITGTKGKTTTTYLIRSILENAGLKVGLIGTNEVIVGREHFPNENTTPDPLVLHSRLAQMREAMVDTVVMEVSSQAIKQRRTEGILFDYGVFTNFAPDHIGPGEHGDLAEYLQCKSELFRHCRVGIVNSDDPAYDQVVQGHTCALETYGMMPGKDYTLGASGIRYVSGRGTHRFSMAFRVTGAMEFEVKMPLPGLFSVYNALAAIGVCRHFAVRESDIERSLRSAKIRGRIEVLENTGERTVLIDYAHNATALENLLKTLKEYHPGRILCLFGCGGNRTPLRRKGMGEVSGRLADLTIITDDNPREEEPEKIREEIRLGVEHAGGKYVCIPGRREAIRYALWQCRAGDIVVLAGKGHETGQEIRGMTYPLDERQIVREILADE